MKNSSLSFDETRDLKNLGLSLLLVPLIWLSFLGWSPDVILGGNDNLTSVIHSFFKLSQVGGDWEKYLHDYGHMGGVPLHEFVGFPFFFKILPKIGIDPGLMLSLTYIFAQSLLGFIGLKGMESFHSFFKEGECELLNPWVRPFVLLFFAFLPVMAWRISYGHFLLFHSSVFIFCLLTAALASRTGLLSRTLLLVMVYLGLCSVPITNQQIQVYSLVFGTPLFLFVFFYQKKLSDLSCYLSFFIVALAILLIASPHLYLIVRYVFSEDAARAVSVTPQAFIYNNASLKDLLLSLTSSVDFLRGSRKFFTLHGINFPWGPILLSLIIFPYTANKKKSFYLWLSFGVPLFVLLLFSLQIEPIVSLLFGIFPILKSFRIPPRILMVFIEIFCLIGLSTLAYNIKKIETKFVLGSALGSVLVFFFLKSSHFEIFCWLSIGGFFIATRFLEFKFKSLGYFTCLLFLTFNNLNGFKDRLLKYTDTKKAFAQTSEVRKVLKKNLKISPPLERMGFYFPDVPFKENTSLAVDIPSVDGYWRPGVRFLKLYFALKGAPYQATAMAIGMSQSHPAFQGMNKIFNVTYFGNFSGGKMTLNQNPNVLGKWWFSESTHAVANWKQMAFDLKKKAPEELRRKVLINELDRPKNLSRQANYNCNGVGLTNFTYEKERALLSFKITGSKGCLMTLATNYYSHLKAVAYNDGKELPIVSFPSYGTLMSLVLPKGSYTVSLSPDLGKLSIFKVFSWLGWLTLLVYFGHFLVVKRERI